jgi:hypothetical protein
MNFYDFFKPRVKTPPVIIHKEVFVYISADRTVSKLEREVESGIRQCKDHLARYESLQAFIKKPIKDSDTSLNDVLKMVIKTGIDSISIDIADWCWLSHHVSTDLFKNMLTSTGFSAVITDRGRGYPATIIISPINKKDD